MVNAERLNRSRNFTKIEARKMGCNLAVKYVSSRFKSRFNNPKNISRFKDNINNPKNISNIESNIDNLKDISRLKGKPKNDIDNLKKGGNIGNPKEENRLIRELAQSAAPAKPKPVAPTPKPNGSTFVNSMTFDV